MDDSIERTAADLLTYASNSSHEFALERQKQLLRDGYARLAHRQLSDLELTALLSLHEERETAQTLITGVLDGTMFVLLDSALCQGWSVFTPEDAEEHLKEEREKRNSLPAA